MPVRYPASRVTGSSPGRSQVKYSRILLKLSGEALMGQQDYGLDAEMVDQHGLGADHVGDGDHREVHRVRLARFRIGGTRAGGAGATAESVSLGVKV